MGPLLHLTLFAAALAPAALVHRVSVHFAGPVAEVTVERSVEAGTAVAERILDLDLPEGAALVDMGITDGGQEIRLAPAGEAASRGSYTSALAARSVAPSRVSLDPSTDLRLHIAAAPASRLLVRYRYTAPLGCTGGRFLLHVPPSLEDNPVAAKVQVDFDRVDLEDATLVGASVRIHGRHTQASATAPARSAWEIGFRLKKDASQFPAQVLAARAKVRPGQKTAPQIAVALCRPENPPRKLSPENVLLLIDRSRSVGQGGMSGQREIARALLEALPASVRFNALYFARGTEALFALPRATTREAIEQLVARADPNRLENGTHLAVALNVGAALLAHETPAKGQRNWLVLITDGSVADGETGDALAAALGKVPAGTTDFIALLARPAADDSVSPEAIAKVQRAAQVLGGMVRVVSADDVQETVRQVLTTMGQGGDLLGVTIDGKLLTSALPPGAGIYASITRAARSRITVGAATGTSVVRGSAPVVGIAPEWAPSVDASRTRAWAASSASGAFFVEAVNAASPTDTVVRGQMDPTILRNALSLAYMPRVRACYLNRRAKTAADFALRGRMRLELQLERGELQEATVRRSDLNHAEIETCVREAAYAIEYPRPMYRDAPTVAALNLVFRPRTAEEQPPPDASPLDRQIELILGPVTFDPNSLVDIEPESASQSQ